MDNPSGTSWKTRRKEQLREELIAKTAQLFNSKGFDSVSVDDIASATGIAKGTFYLYFKTKADIVRAVLESSIDDLEKRVCGVLAETSGDAPTSLRAAVNVLMSFLEDNPGLVSPLLENGLEDYQLASEAKERLRGRCRAATMSAYERLFRMGMLQRCYREFDPQLAAHAFVGMLAGLIHRAMETGESLRETGEVAVDILEQGIVRTK